MGPPVGPVGTQSRSDLEPLLLQVELPLEPVHHLIGDLTRVAQGDDGAALRLDHLADHGLVGVRALLERLAVAVASSEPAAAILEGAAHALRGVLARPRSEEHTSELQSRRDLVCRLLLEKKKK